MCGEDNHRNVDELHLAIFLHPRGGADKQSLLQPGLESRGIFILMFCVAAHVSCFNSLARNRPVYEIREPVFFAVFFRC